MSPPAPSSRWSNLHPLPSFWFAALIAAAFLVGHLLLLPSAPTGVDAANFVLGVRDFDVGDHRPHPPGYPVFIALGKVSAVVLERVMATAPGAAIVRIETYAVAMWSAIFGALSVFALRRLFLDLEGHGQRALAAAALTIACPLFWFSGTRAMSDLTGLTAALTSQALAVAAIRYRGTGSSSHLLVGAAFIAGVATGVRVQALWLALPLVAVAAVVHVRRTGVRVLVAAAGALAAGGLLWAVPLMQASGGADAYLAALGGQAAEDVEGVTMLASNADIGLARDAVVRTLAYPWANKYLAGGVLGLAGVGLVALAVRAPTAALLLILAFGPYAVLDLLFQDTTFLRYALPVVPATAFLAVRGIGAVAPRAVPWGAGVLVAVSMGLAIPPAVRHAQTGGPTMRAVEDIRVRAAQEDPTPVLAMHHAVSRVVRLEAPQMRVLPSAPHREWLELARYWRDGGRAPVWMLAEPERTDLASIDPASRQLVKRYRLAVDQRYFLSGVRPSGVDWYDIQAPGWFVEEGWALTPETAGVAAAAARGPALSAVSAYVRRRDEPTVLIVGGRHLRPGGPDVRFDLTIDDRPVEQWTVEADPGFFLRLIHLPAGSLRPIDRHGPGGDESRHTAEPYAHLQVRSAPADGSGAIVPTSVEQFDVQSHDRVVSGLGDGWFEQESDLEAQRRWRWMGPTGVVQVHHAGHDLELRVAGEAPVAWLGGTAEVIVRADREEVGRFAAADAFDVRLRIGSAAVERARGRLTLESSRAFVPHELFGTGDRRRLALRVYEWQLSAAPAIAPVR